MSGSALHAVLAALPIVVGAGIAAAEGPVTPLLDRIDASLAAGAADFIELRHDLHRNPELSGEEKRTARVVAEHMRGLGLDVRTRVGGHGVVAILTGGRPGPLVAYRADMDAVPSTGLDPVEFRSVVPGVRHQCGHDVHTAIAVALATALTGVRADLSGSVMFIFQPAEERLTGAKAMLADGVFARAKPVAIYAVHTAPIEVGLITTRPGPTMAARDGVRITIRGDGDHGAAKTAVLTAARAASTIAVSMPTDGEAPETVPDDFSAFFPFGVGPLKNGKTIIQGGVYVATAAARERARQTLADGFGTIGLPSITVTYEYEAKFAAGVTNDAALTARALAALRGMLGATAVQTMPGVAPPPFSEDFGSFQEQVPGVYFFLGVNNAAKGHVGMPHSRNYVADDDAIVFGARAMAAVLLDRMAQL